MACPRHCWGTVWISTFVSLTTAYTTHSFEENESNYGGFSLAKFSFNVAWKSLQHQEASDPPPTDVQLPRMEGHMALTAYGSESLWGSISLCWPCPSRKRVKALYSSYDIRGSLKIAHIAGAKFLILEGFLLFWLKSYHILPPDVPVNVLLTTTKHKCASWQPELTAVGATGYGHKSGKTPPYFLIQPGMTCIIIFPLAISYNAFAITRSSDIRASTAAKKKIGLVLSCRQKFDTSQGPGTSSGEGGRENFHFEKHTVMAFYYK